MYLNNKALLFVFGCVLAVTQSEDLCWSTFGNYQYKVVTSGGGLTFDGASAMCESQNTTLASIHSKDEDNFVQEFVMTQLSIPLWIGLRRHDYTFNWTDGSAVDYVNPSYKRKAFSESCIYAFQGWTDASCVDAKLYFICKRIASGSNACTTTTVYVPTTTPIPTTSVTKETTLESTTTAPVNESTSATTSISTVNGVSTSQTESAQKIPDSTDKTSTSVLPIVTTTERTMTFEELLDDMTIKEKPVYKTREARASKAIGTVSIMILVALVVGVVLLDISTIIKQIKLLKYNTKGRCCNSKRNKTSDSLQMIKLSMDAMK